MKKLVETTEVADAMEMLIGERITLFGLNYIYTGKLTGVNAAYIELEDAAIVYETGPFSEAKWKDAQPLPKPCYVMLHCVESFMILK